VDLQRLPLPVGSPHPVRTGRLRRRRWRIRAWWRPLLAAAGLAAAAAGAVLGTTPPAVPVALDTGSYRIGDATLPAAGGGVYAGQAGALVIATGPSGTRAAGSTRLHGRPATGSCAMPASGATERCAFGLAGRTITADDRLHDGGWDRRYADGQAIRIQLAGGRPIPVPFPIGR
jgi:hypothetical protein